MCKRLKIIVVAGARPNFMKVAPFMKAVQRHNEARLREGEATVEAKLVHTGQHYDDRMSGVFFRELGIGEPDVNLGVGSGSNMLQTAATIVGFTKVCETERPDWVVVVGDVNSTMACTLTCAQMGIRVAHIEAGLRSFDRSMPEEVNRIVTDSLADLLLTPSVDADENLLREGIRVEKIACVGNIMIDALVGNLEHARGSGILEQARVKARDYAYVTLHRPSNVDDRGNLEAIFGEIKRLSKRLAIVFPMHPRTRKMCQQFGISLLLDDRIRILEPLGYHDSLKLVENARFVLTDSGGLQEESTFFRTPCLTLRPNTERPITITVGSNKLTRFSTLSSDVDEVLKREERYGQVPALWDGNTAERVLVKLLAFGEDMKSVSSPGN